MLTFKTGGQAGGGRDHDGCVEVGGALGEVVGVALGEVVGGALGEVVGGAFCEVVGGALGEVVPLRPELGEVIPLLPRLWVGQSSRRKLTWMLSAAKMCPD